MKKTSILLFIVIINHSFFAEAQNRNQLINGKTNSISILGSSSIEEKCQLSNDDLITLDPGIDIFIYQFVTCNNGLDDKYRVVYNGKKLIVSTKTIDVNASDITFLKTLDKESQDKLSSNADNLVSQRDKELHKAFNTYSNTTLSAGIAIIDDSLLNESEYTSGTGVSIEVKNMSTKTIKYIWFTLQAINPVNDPVGTKTVKAIGPINTQETVSYRFEYVWLTDAVEHYKIPNIKLQYMDGTFKSISNGRKLVEPGKFTEMLPSVNIQTQKSRK